MNTYQRIQKTPGDLSKNIGILFAEHGKQEAVARGSSVFHEGQPYRGVFYIAEGTFKWIRVDATGNECVLKIYGPGEIAGLPPLFSPTSRKKYVATLTAMTDGKVIHWPEGDFHTFMRKQPEWLLTFNRQFSFTMSDLVDQAAAVTMKSVPDRLLDFLGKLGAAENWVNLPFRKHQLAATLNTSPETLSRAFATLKKQQRIEVRGRQYRLPQAD